MKYITRINQEIGSMGWNWTLSHRWCLWHHHFYCSRTRAVENWIGEISSSWSLDVSSSEIGDLNASSLVV